MSFNKHEKLIHDGMRAEVEGNFLIINNYGEVINGDIYRTLEDATINAKDNIKPLFLELIFSPLTYAVINTTAGKVHGLKPLKNPVANTMASVPIKVASTFKLSNFRSHLKFVLLQLHQKGLQ